MRTASTLSTIWTKPGGIRSPRDSACSSRASAAAMRSRIFRIRAARREWFRAYSLAVSRLNLFGSGQTLTLQGVLSTLQKRAVLNYFVPRIFDTPKLDATFSILYDDTYDVRTFQSKREEATVKLTQHVSKPITIFYDFSYRHVGVSDLKINPLLLPQLAQSVRVGIAEINLIQDRRDDPLDPHKGIYNTLNVGLATKILRFADQLRCASWGETRHIIELGEKLVLARETQVGPAARLLLFRRTRSRAIPFRSPSVFSAAAAIHSGDSPKTRPGPRDTLTGFPLGGSALVLQQHRTAISAVRRRTSTVCLFEDAGNIYSSLGSISFRVDQRNPADFDYMVHAVGFGIRYRTPIGPLRLDLAYSINPPRYNGFPGNYSQLMQCSVANTCQASPLQISHFQFFFSIGQAFLMARNVSLLAMPAADADRCRPAVIVDRIAVAVGDKIITDSEIDLRIRLSAFQNGEKPDFSLSSRQGGGAGVDRSKARRARNGCWPLSSSGRDSAERPCSPNTQKADYKSDPGSPAPGAGRYGLTAAGSGGRSGQAIGSAHVSQSAFSARRCR